MKTGLTITKVLVHLSALLALQAHGATLQGRVTVAGGQIPVEGATVQLDSIPIDGVVDLEASTDSLGRYFIDVADDSQFSAEASHPYYLPDQRTISVGQGEVTENFRLGVDAETTPPEGRFHIAFEVHGVVSQSALPNVSVTITRYNGEEPGAAVMQNDTLLTDGNPEMRVMGYEEGWFHFSFSKQGWEAFEYPASGGRIHLDQSHTAVVGLKPVLNPLVVHVKGIDPSASSEGHVNYGDLSRVFVEVTGLDWNSMEFSLAPRTDTTGADGSAVLSKLPPVPLQVRVFKLGYEPWTDTVLPKADGSFDPLDVELQLHFDTQIAVAMDWIYGPITNFGNFEGTVTGLPNSGAAGVELRWSHADDQGRMVFDELLPGRYRVSIRPTQSGPNDAVQLSTATAGFSTQADNYLTPYNKIYALFEPVELVVEVADTETATRQVELQVTPVEISGKLKAAEDGAPTGWPYALGTYGWRPKASARIEVVPHGDPENWPEGISVTEVHTAEDGSFSLTLPPGPYGFRLPDETDYTAYDMDMVWEHSITGQRRTVADRDIYWPAPTPWPFQIDASSRVRAPFVFDSNKSYAIELKIVKQSYKVQLDDVQAQGFLPFMAFYDRNMTMFADTSFMTASALQLNVAGPAETTTWYDPTIYDGRYLVGGLIPGSYTLTADHPFNVFGDDDVITIEVPDNGAPGVPPAAGAFTRTTVAGQISGEVPATGDDGFYLAGWLWDEEQSEYHETTSGCGGELWLEYAALPGVFMREETSLPGTLPATMYLEREGAWMVQTLVSAGEAIKVNIYCGGPNDSFTSLFGPAFATQMEVTGRVLGTQDGLPIEGVGVKIADGVYITHGQTLTISSEPPYDADTDVLGWVITDRRLLHTSGSPPRGIYQSSIQKTLEIAGTLTTASGTPVVGTVQAYSTNGSTIDDDVADTQGAFRIPVGTRGARGVLLGAEVAGYYPVRKRFAVALDADAVSDCNVHLTPIPGPEVGSIEQNRFGLFLPGVIKSGDATGFDPNNAASNVTSHVTAAVQPRSITYELDAFDDQTGPTVSITRPDPIRTVYLVDPRRFSAHPEDADPDQPTYLELDGMDFAAWKALELNIRTGTTGEAQPQKVLSWKMKPTGTSLGFGTDVKLWTLPAGPFAPAVVAVSAAGGIGTSTYQPPANHPRLRGAAVPEWAQSVLNVIGTIDASNASDFINRVTPQGFIVPSATFDSGIGLRPDGTVTYHYIVGVDFKHGQPGPLRGLVSLASRFVGLSARGQVEFYVDGFAGTVRVGGGGGLTLQAADELGLLKPGTLWKLPITPVQPSLSITAALENVTAVGEDGVTFPNYRLQRAIGGRVKSGMRLDIAPLTYAIPIVGTTLAGLHAAGMQLNVRWLTEIGGTTRQLLEFGSPVIGGTDPDTRERTLSFIGTGGNAEPVPPSSFDFMSNLSLEWVSPGKRLSLAGGVQLGPPNDTSLPGLRVTFADDDRYPIVRRVEGALSATIEAGFRIGGGTLSKKWQWDAVDIDWQSGTEAYMSLSPVHLDVSFSDPTTAPEPRWINHSGVLVEDNYRGGSQDAETSGGLVYVGTDAEAGEALVMFAAPDGTGLSTPVEVARAPGLVDVAVVQHDDGSWTVAWIAVEADAVGDPFARTRVYRAHSADGHSWSSPTLLADPGAYAFHLQVKASGQQTAFCWLMGSTATTLTPAIVLVVDSGAGNPTQHEVLGPTQVRDVALAAAFDQAAPEFTILIHQSDGVVLERTWDGEALAEAYTMVEDVRGAIALAYDLEDQAVAVVERDNALALVLRHAEQDWRDFGDPLEGVVAAEARLAILADGEDELYLVVWTEDGDPDQLRYAVFDQDGDLVDGPSAPGQAEADQLESLELCEQQGDPPQAQAIVIARAGADEELLSYTVRPFEGIFPSESAPAVDGGVVNDGGTVDAAETDADVRPEAGPGEEGGVPPDAGEPVDVDAASTDADGTADGGIHPQLDSGPGTDRSSVPRDAASGKDKASGNGGDEPAPSCGDCSSGSAGNGLAAMVLVALVLMRRKHLRRR